MKVLVVIGLSVLALAFLIAPVHLLISRGWGATLRGVVLASMGGSGGNDRVPRGHGCSALVPAQPTANQSGENHVSSLRS